MYHCVQVRVQYAKVPYKNGTNAKSINDNDWVDLRRIDVVENKVRYSPNKNSELVCNKAIETVIILSTDYTRPERAFFKNSKLLG